MDVCSQHSSCTSTIIKHGERIASLETRINQVEEVQDDMVSQLRDAANGLRALASKIDTAVSQANGESVPEKKQQEFTGSLNHAWRHFQDNFAIFIVYATVSLFAWAVLKMGVFKEFPPFIERLLG